MSKKTIILIISTLAIIGVIVFGVWYFTKNGGGDTQINDFFSFGLPDLGDNGNGLFGIGGDKNLQPDGFEQPKQVLRQLSQTATAGITTTTRTITIEGEEKTVDAARTVERSTGHVHDVVLDSLDRIRVSNTTIPRVYEVLWKNDASGFLARFLDDTNSIIKTFSADIAVDENTGDEGSLDGVFLEENIGQIAVSPDDDLFYLTDTSSGAVGIKTAFDGEVIKQVADLEFTEWLYQWATEGRVFLTTKPSFSTSGYMYSLNIGDGSLEKILGGINGLTTLASNDGENIIYSVSTERGLILSIYNASSGNGNILSLITLPEKCVWKSDNVTIYCGVPTSIPNGEYPDNWYKGTMSFSDSIWKLDIEVGTAELLASPTELLGIEMDVIKPAVSESGKYLVFINKKDLTAWALEL